MRNIVLSSTLSLTVLSLTLSATLLAACSGGDSAVHDGAEAAPQPPNAASGEASSPPAGTGDGAFAPKTSRDAGSGGSPIVAPGASFDLPAHWVSEPRSSSMRLAQARIPGPDGEGQLTVFYFGPGGGGGVEANLQRWMGQVEADAGEEPRRDTFAVGGFTVTWVDVAGTLKPSTMGTGPSTPQPGSRLLAAVVEGPQGPWFFKATGPATTLAAERDAFLGMLRSATPNV